MLIFHIEAWTVLYYYKIVKHLFDLNKVTSSLKMILKQLMEPFKSEKVKQAPNRCTHPKH